MRKIFKEIKKEIKRLGVTNFLTYLLGSTLTVFCLSCLSKSTGLKDATFFVSISFVGWLITDTIFLYGIELAKRANLYKIITSVVGMFATFWWIIYGISYAPMCIMLLASLIFSIMFKVINIPLHIAESYGFIIPKEHSIAYKEVIYDMLYYIKPENGKEYKISIGVGNFEEYSISLFEKVSIQLFKNYCGTITCEKIENNLRFAINYDTFEQMQECINKLNKDTYHG